MKEKPSTQKSDHLYGGTRKGRRRVATSSEEKRLILSELEEETAAPSPGDEEGAHWTEKMKKKEGMDS